jgi:multiple sugar transport system substrate-binding protein
MNKELRRAFAAATGRTLEPPLTWAEYRELAAFFSGRPGPDGSAPSETLAGTPEAYGRDGQRI